MPLGALAAATKVAPFSDINRRHSGAAIAIMSKSLEDVIRKRVREREVYVIQIGKLGPCPKTAR